MLRLFALSAVGLLGLLLSPAHGAAQERPPGCSDPVHRAFDFWIGSWEVRLDDGSLAGRNTIRAQEGGCALFESWNGAGGSIGESVNFVDPSTDRWHQVWVDNGGLVLRLEGGPVGDAMRMEGRGNDPSRLHRITWTPLEDGRIRQHWEVSADEGESWNTAFDGYYSRSEEGP